MTRLALQPVREPVQRAGQLVALNEGSLGIEPTVKAHAADAAGESTKLRRDRRGYRGPVDVAWNRCGGSRLTPRSEHRTPASEAPVPVGVMPPQADRFTCPAGDRVTSVTTATTCF